MYVVKNTTLSFERDTKTPYSFFLYHDVAKDDVDDFVSFFGRRAIALCTAFAKVVVVVVVDFFRARRTRTKLATQRCFGVSYLYSKNIFERYETRTRESWRRRRGEGGGEAAEVCDDRRETTSDDHGWGYWHLRCHRAVRERVRSSRIIQENSLGRFKAISRS